MFDLIAARRQRPMPLRDVANLIPGRKGRESLHYETVRQWSTKGLKAGETTIKLKTFLVGGTRCTTETLLAAFLSMLNGDDGAAGAIPAVPSGPSPRELAKERFGI